MLITQISFSSWVSILNILVTSFEWECNNCILKIPNSVHFRKSSMFLEKYFTQNIFSTLCGIRPYILSKHISSYSLYRNRLIDRITSEHHPFYGKFNKQLINFHRKKAILWKGIIYNNEYIAVDILWKDLIKQWIVINDCILRN